MNAPAQVKVFNKYHSTFPSIRYAFKSGKLAIFVGGVYITSIQSEIDELEAEIKDGHPHIYVDAKEKTVESDKIDPLAGIKKKAIEEFLAAQAAAHGKDMGNTSSTPTEKLPGVQTTQSIAATAVQISGTK